MTILGEDNNNDVKGVQGMKEMVRGVDVQKGLRNCVSGASSGLKNAYETVKFKTTTREGLIGDYDYKYLFTPKIPFMKKSKKGDKNRSTFFAVDSSLPLLLAILLGFQHSLAMIAGIVTPPLLMASAANFDAQMTQYLVSAAMIGSGLLSLIHIIRFRIPGTHLYVGTGLISVVGASFSTITVFTTGLPIMYKSGVCPVSETGAPLPCPEGYGMIIATASLCALIELLCSFLPSKFLMKLFPPVVTGPVVLVIGVSLIQSGFKDWAGGAGPCFGRPTSGDFMLCPSNDAPMAAPWGSAQFIGLGFLVYIAILTCEKYGAPIMKSCAVVIGLLVGCIVAAACGYFDATPINEAPVATFLWTTTFPLKLYGPVVLPLLAVYLTIMMETIGDITATCDVSRVAVSGPEYESRIKGGIRGDGIIGSIAGLLTLTPCSTFAQNNGVISLTKCANRQAGGWACFFILMMGIFSKFAAAFVSIPKPVIGGMTTFLFTSVAVSGLAIISRNPITRRDRIVLTASLVLGLGATLVNNWFSFVFTYEGDNQSLQGFLDAIQLVMSSGFSVTGFVGVIANLIIDDDEEEDDDDSEEEKQETLEICSSSSSVTEVDLEAGRKVD